MIYLISAPQNKLEEKHRVAGWRFVPMGREEKTALRELCAPLKDKKVQCVYASDLDEEAARIVSFELHCSHHSEFGLRRFNAGRNHGAKEDYFQTMLERKFVQWKTNEDVPVRGGDSWTSVKKRLFKAVDSIMSREGELVLLTDSHTATLIGSRTPQALVANGTGVKPGKVFVVKRN